MVSKAQCPRIFLDTNILIDYVIGRGPDSINAEKLFELCVEGRIECYIAAHSLLNMFYVLRKYFSVNKRKLIIDTICILCNVHPVDNEKLIKVARGSHGDIEDHMQILCAEECHADYFVTRDMRGFRSSSVNVLKPAELLGLLK